MAKTRKPNMTAADHEEMIRLHNEEGWGSKQLAERFNVAPGTISSRLSKDPRCDSTRCNEMNKTRRRDDVRQRHIEQRETKTCQVCSKEFLVTRWDRQKKYCSGACRGMGQRKRIEKTCPVCDKKWETTSSDNAIHCSHVCRAKADETKTAVQCRHCGKEIMTTDGVDQKFCSRECYWDSQKKPAERRACSRCGLVKHETKFANLSQCKKCAHEAHKVSLAKPEGRFKYAVNEARRRCLEWSITFDQYIAFVRQPCRYCDGRLSLRGTGLDRLDNSKGYAVDNVVPCCGRCNRVKHDYFTFEEMLLLGETIKKIDAARPPEKPDASVLTQPSLFPDVAP